MKRMDADVEDDRMVGSVSRTLTLPVWTTGTAPSSSCKMHSLKTGPWLRLDLSSAVGCRR
jgi:tellurite resistance-related uncharacterized protein